jgi:hypothetical protein
MMLDKQTQAALKWVSWTRQVQAQHDRDLQRFEQESRDEDHNPAPPDFTRIWSDWDRYDAEQSQRWEVSGE